MRSLTIIGIISSVVLFFIGYLTFASFFVWTMPKTGNIIYISDPARSPFIRPLLFALALSLIPLAIVSIWKFAPVTSTEKRIYSSLLIVACAVLAGLLRYWMIRRMIQQLTAGGEEIKQGISATGIYMEVYLILGIITGSAIALLLFRRKKPGREKFSFESMGA